MANPYEPTAHTAFDDTARSTNDCPVCRLSVNRLRLAVPLLKCPHCSTRLFLRLPFPIAASWVVVMLALVFAAYRWLSADPIRFLNHIWIVGLLPAPLAIACIAPVMLAFGRPCANNGFRNLTQDEIQSRRHVYLRNQDGGEP
ncbi:hypothetical protein Pla22_49940 [Rubripirellula amarantea]|uniref:Uncharacterized protein n=1 Tax=Rubripirellula amarantea TaxID=2527999 RepID=A0A5C5WBI7_9BACT|nr:hypothetical protein [Rubripirellula amarantea]TWT47994.1 hypothetical protein Pla22_49940 [Rubripirellula amarantea]